MEYHEALDNMAVGIALLAAQGVITTNPYFNEAEIKKYLKARRAFHPTFTEACAVVADNLPPKYAPAVGPLLRISQLNARQTQQALRQAVRAFRSLGRIKPGDVDDPKLSRFLFVLRDVLRLTRQEEQGRYYNASTELELMFKAVIRNEATPPQIRTLFRRVLKLGLRRDTELSLSANPGAWFDFPPEKQATYRHQARRLEQMEKDAFNVEDPDERYEMYKRIADAKAGLQHVAGVNLQIIDRSDKEPLDRVLRRESKMNIDGPTAYVADRFVKRLEESVAEYPEQYQAGKREIGKVITQLRKARTYATMERVVGEAVDRRTLPSHELKGLQTLTERASRNKAVRDGVPLAPLTYEPVDPEDFREKYGGGLVKFDPDYTEEEQREILGRVDRALSDLESIYGKGITGKHARPLNFEFEGGSGAGWGAMASYFGWDNRNRWQPRVRFGRDFDNLLAHELSHYYEDLLAFRIKKAFDPDMPEYQYGDVEHGQGDIFGRTGVALDVTLRGFQRARDHVEKEGEQTYLDALVIKHVPELVEVMEVVHESPDYQRWKDLVPGAYESVMHSVLKEMGIGYDDPRWDEYMNAEYKSQLPPEVVEKCENEYQKLMQGDTRKLRYNYSSTEIWARMCEQYVYTKLAEVGIANPWLTQLTYDIDVMPKFMDEAYFDEHLKPVFDRLFNKLEQREILAAMASRVASRYLA